MKIEKYLTLFLSVWMLVGCTEEDPFAEDGLRLGEQALRGDVTRGRSDADHPHNGDDLAETDWNNDALEEVGTPPLPPGRGFVRGEEAEALIESLGLVPSVEEVEQQGKFCSTDSPSNRARNEGLNHRSVNAQEPYVASLYTEEPRSWPPDNLQHFEEVEPTITTAAVVGLSEMGQLLENYRADGCADDRFQRIPRCRNHPYRLALTEQFDDLSKLPMQLLEPLE